MNPYDAYAFLSHYIALSDFVGGLFSFGGFTARTTKILKMFIHTSRV